MNHWPVRRPVDGDLGLAAAVVGGRDRDVARAAELDRPDAVVGPLISHWTGPLLPGS